MPCGSPAPGSPGVPARAPAMCRTPVSGSRLRPVAAPGAKPGAETTLSCARIGWSQMEKLRALWFFPFSPELFSLSLFLLFAFLSLSLLQTLSFFFLPQDFLLSFLSESRGRYCPVFALHVCSHLCFCTLPSPPVSPAPPVDSFFPRPCFGNTKLPRPTAPGFRSSAGTSPSSRPPSETAGSPGQEPSPPRHPGHTAFHQK